MTDELDQLLAAWALGQRLSADQVLQIRARVLAAGEDQATLEAEWLWKLLRPVTDLLEQVGGARALRQLGVDDDDAVPFTPYLRLA